MKIFEKINVFLFQFVLISFLLINSRFQSKVILGQISTENENINLYSTSPKIYNISSNYMYSYRIKFMEVDTPIYITFEIDEKSFIGSKKSIFIYSDEENSPEKGICTHTTFEGTIENEQGNGQKFEDYPMSVFQFRKNNDGYIYQRKATIKYIPKIKNGIVNLKVQTVDEGVVVFSGKRSDRIYQASFNFGYEDSFYIASLTDINSKDTGVLFIEQLSGEFTIHMLNHVTESHLLPLSTDKIIVTNKNIYSQLSTKFEIIHIIKKYYGFANIYFIASKNDGYQMKESSIAFFFINGNSEFNCFLPKRTVINEAINYEFKSLTKTKININIFTKQTKSFSLSSSNYVEEGKTEKLDLNSNYTVNFKAEENSIIIFTAINGDNYYKVIEKPVNNITDKRILIKIDKEANDQYSVLGIGIHPLDGNKRNSIKSILNKATKSYLVPKPIYSCQNIYDFSNYNDLTFMNPYTYLNLTEKEFYYMGFEVENEEIFPYDIVFKHSIKKMPNHTIEANNNEMVYLDGKNMSDVLLPISIPMSNGLSLLVHSCNFYKEEYAENKINLDYYDAFRIWEENINNEYQVFTLSNSFNSMLIHINDQIKLDYSGFMLSFYLYPSTISLGQIPSQESLMTKINNLRSVKYLFEQKDGKLVWTALSSESDETGININSRKFFLCEVSNNEVAKEYYNNLCYIEHLMEKGYKCKVTSDNEYPLNDLVKNIKYSIFEEVDLPLKVRYYIGTYTFDEIEGSELGRVFGSYFELIDEGTPNVPESISTFYFYEYNKFPLNNEGIIYIQASSKENAKEISNKIIATECIYNKREISEEIIDNIISGKAGLTYEAKIGFENNLVKIMFSKRGGGKENFIVIKIDNSKNYELKIIVHGMVEQNEISDNLMESHFIKLGKAGIPIYVKFHLIDENFRGDKKGIFLYTDAYSTGIANNYMWVGDVIDEDKEESIIYYNLELTAFKLRQEEDEETGEVVKTAESVIVKFVPIIDYENVNLRIQTTDEGIVFHTGERINRVFQVLFTFGYCDPFYIVASYSDIMEGILYIEQESGLFGVDFINTPSDTHILPLPSDKHFEPIEGHYSKLNTKFEIYHISMKEPGLARYYTIVESGDSPFISNINSVSFYHLKPSLMKTIKFINNGKKLNIKLNLIMGENSVNGILGESFKLLLNKQDNRKYYSEIEYTKIQLSSDSDAIISITLSENDYFSKKISSDTDGLTDKRLIIEFPREDYYEVIVSIKSEEEKELIYYNLLGIERKDKYNFIPDPKFSGNFLYFKNEEEYFSLSINNPYDEYDIGSNEIYYYSLVIENNPVPKYSISFQYKLKESIIKNKINPGEFLLVENINKDSGIKSSRIFLARPKYGEKPRKFLLMTHSCNYYKLEEKNLIQLNFFDEEQLWNETINSEYQFYNLTYAYHEMDAEITFNNKKNDFNDIILSYYFYEKYTPYIEIATKNQLIKDSENIRSEKYLIEIVDQILKWSIINDRKSYGIIKRNYLICPLNNNILNECKLQKLINENNISCEYTSNNIYQLNSSYLNKYMAIFQEVEIPIKVRYLIGSILYASKKEEIKPEYMGNFIKLNTSNIYTLAPGEIGLFYSDVSFFRAGGEGILAIKAKNEEIIEKAKYIKYNDELKENVLNETLEKGNNLKIYKDIDDELLEIIFKKPEDSVENDYYVLVVKIKNTNDNSLRIMYRGEIESIIIKDDLTLTKTVNYNEIGVPLYFHFVINNLNKNKKGVLLYTNNDEHSGRHVVFPGSYSQRGGNPFANREFKNYSLSAFLFRKAKNGTFSHNSVTIKLLPSSKQKSIIINVQTTDEGLLIFNGERINRVYNVIFSHSYNSPFYIISTRPNSISSKNNNKFGYLYIEQIVGLFKINMVNSHLETHILPLDTDKNFLPLEKHYSNLYTNYEIIHINQINPGQANFYFFAENGSNMLTLKENSEELIYFPANEKFIIYFPSNKQEKYNLKLKYILTAEEIGINIPIGDKTYKLTSSNPLATIENIELESITVKCPVDSFISLSIVSNSFYKSRKVYSNSEDSLNDKYLLIKFPKGTEYSKINVTLKPIESQTSLSLYSIFTIESDNKYIPDPLNCINKNYYGTDERNLLSLSISNPYDQYNVSENEAYYLNVKILDDIIPKYNLKIETNKPNTKDFINFNNNHLFYLNKYSNKESNPLSLEVISPKPKALSLFIHQCNYHPNKNNTISLNYYDGETLWKKQLTKEFEVFNLLNDFQHMNIKIKRQDNPDSNNFDDFILSYYLYNNNEYNNIKNESSILQKIEYLLGESYIINIENNKLHWKPTNLYQEQGSSINIHNREYLLCQLDEDDQTKKYLSNICYIQNKINLKNDICKRTKNNEYDIRELNSNKIVLILQEFELPIKVRLFIGVYSHNVQQYDKPYYIAIGVITSFLLIAITALICICKKKKNKITLNEIENLALIQEDLI